MGVHTQVCSTDAVLLPLRLQQPFSPQGTRGRAALDARAGQVHEATLTLVPPPSFPSTYFLVEKETGCLKPASILPSSTPSGLSVLT